MIYLKINLVNINRRYEEIIHSNFSQVEKNEQLRTLMSMMERTYKIPTQRNLEWEQENKAVIALYRKISMSRDI